ncbi:hypothetical protein VTL71DRAFT_2212 [Oculimacula yallundae]|uniref:Uncharacterized protein n=1 Tax=Oculimacula yallundae TaxID=86028 RepID=A0ABR4C9J6_9HELO
MPFTTNIVTFLLSLPVSILTVAVRLERPEPVPSAELAPAFAKAHVQVPDFQTNIDWVELEVPGYEKGSLVEPPLREFIPTYHWTEAEDI